MAGRSAVLFFITFFLLSASFTVQGSRKLQLEGEKKQMKVVASTLKDSLILAALPKGTVPSSTPSKKEHSTTLDEKLIARHLAAIDRILQSVPSPGVGH